MIGSKIHIIKKLAALMILSAVSSCEHPVKPGRYVYKTSEQHCEIELRKDGHFRETIHYIATGERFEKVGNWSQQNSGLLFDPFLYSMDGEKLKMLNPPKEFGGAPAEVHGDVLVFIEDAEYWFKLQK